MKNNEPHTKNNEPHMKNPRYSQNNEILTVLAEKTAVDRWLWGLNRSPHSLVVKSSQPPVGRESVVLRWYRCDSRSDMSVVGSSFKSRE